jgi:autotransporter-associated beta strand protein
MNAKNICIVSQIVGLFLLTGACGLKAASGNDTWNGGGGDNNWNTAGNWTAGSANKPPIAGDSIFFDGLTQLNANNNFTAPANSFNGINFNATAGAFILTGNQVTNLAAIVDNSTNSEIINLPMVFPGLQAITTTKGASLLIGGVISGAGGINANGFGTVTLTNNNTYTGGTTNNAGTLALDFSGGAANNIVTTNLAFTLGGGNLVINGRSGALLSQTFNGLTLNSGGFSGMNLNANGAVNLTNVLGLITVNTVGSPNSDTNPGCITFNGPATVGANNVAVAATGIITTTTVGRPPTGVIATAERENAYATVGLYDWASTDLPNGTAGTSPYTIIGGSQVTGFYFVPTNNNTFAIPNTTNIDIALQQIPGNITNEANLTGCNAETVRFNSPHAPYGHIPGTGSIQVGGILITPNMGPVNAAISQVRLVSLALQIFQNNPSGVFILAAINDSNGGTELVKSGVGTMFINPIASNNIAMNYLDPGNTLVVVTNSDNTSPNYGLSTNYNFPLNSFAGSLWKGGFFLNGGVTVINSSNVLGVPSPQLLTPGCAGAVNLHGGTLMSDLNDLSLFNGPAAANRPVFLGIYGGGLAAASGTTMTVGGPIANSVPGVGGPLTLGIAPSSANANVVGLVPGMGGGLTGTNGNPALFAMGTVALGGVNTYTGGTILQSGTAQISGINNLGGSGTYGGVTIKNGSTLQYAPSAIGSGSFDVSPGNGITLSSGGGTIDVNGNSVTYANSIGNGGSGALTVMSSVAISNAILTLQGANTYTGTTTITNVTLLANNTSGSATGTNAVAVQNGGTLGGSGTIGGSVMVNSGGQTLPGATGATNTIGGNLTYASGASANFVLTPSAAGGGNDQIVLSGASSVLTCGGVNVGINCSLVLDQNQDYVLMKLTGGSASISGSFNATPVWLGTTPIGAAKYSVVVSGKQVLLHNSSPTPPPTITATSANPNPVLALQTLNISATVVPGAGTIDPNSGVTVDLTPIASSVQPLIYDGAGHYTNSFLVGVTAVPGNFTLNVVAQDSLGGAAIGYISLVVGNSATWTGADAASNSSWSDGTNWISGLPPGYGDDLVFAGGVGLTPVMDSSYNVASVTFSNNAGSFNLNNSGGSILAIVNGVTNKSANVQTLNLPVTVSGALTLNAASGGLVLNGLVSGSGGLTVAGTNTTTLAGLNTYTGNTSISSGSTLAVNNAGQLGADNGGIYAGLITNTGTLTFNSSAAQTLSGVLSGTGVLNQIGSGVLTLAAANSNPGGFSGPIVISGTNAQVTLGGDQVQVAQGGSGTGQVTLTNGGSFTMNGAGLTTAYGTCLNPILVPAGTTGNLFPMGNGTYSGNVTVHGTLNVYETYQRGAAGGSWTNSDGQINISNNLFYLNIGGNFSFGTAAVNLGPGVYIINAGNTSVGGNTITIGELTGDPGSFITDNTGAAAGRPCIYVVGGRNSNATFPGTIYDTARGTGITKVGTGSWTLTGSDTYTQPTTISAGSLIVGPSSFMMNCTNITVAAGALFDVSSYGGLTLSAANNLGGSGVVTGAVTAVGNNIINAGVGSTPGTLSFSNSFAESGPNVTNNFNLSTDPTGVSKTNSLINVAGNLTLMGMNMVAIKPVNGLLGAGTYTLFKYSGNLINESGVVPAGTLLTNNLVAAGAFAANSDVVLTFSNTPKAVVMIVTPNGQNLTWKGGFTTTVTNITATSTNIVLAATNNWDVNVSSNWLNVAVVTNFLQYDNVTFDNTSTNFNVVVAGTVAPGSVTVNSTNAYAFSGSGIIAGLSGITKSGTNVLAITNTGVNSYTGGVAINAGTVQIGSATSLGATNSTTTIASGATLDIRGVTAVAQQIVVQGSGVGGNGAIVNKGAALSNQGFTGNVSLAGDTTFGGTNRWDIYTGTLTGNSHNLAKVGTNVIALTSLGDIGVSNINVQAGSFLVASNTTLGSNNATLYLWSGAGLTLNNSTVTNTKPVSLTNANVTSSTGTNVYGGSIGLNGIGIFTATTPMVLNGVLSGSGGLVQNGASILTLSGTNTYNGTTTVSNGVVALVGNASIAGSTNVNLAVTAAQLNVTGLTGSILTLANGQTLQGIGSINGSITNVPGSTIRPGIAVVGTLTVSNTAALGGNIVMVLTNAGVSSKLLAGSIVYGGTLTPTNLGTALVAGNTFTLFGAGSQSGNFSSIVGSPGTGLGYSFNPATGVLSIVATVNTNPTNITATVSGNVLTLSWPADHLGWHLQAQTNSTANGLGTNWVTIPSSSSSNTYTNTINTSNGTVFYRMVYP